MILCLGEFAGQRERLKPIGSVCFPLGNLQENMSSFFFFFFFQFRFLIFAILTWIVQWVKRLRFTLMYVATQMAKIGTLGRFQHRPQYIYLTRNIYVFVFNTVSRFFYIIFDSKCNISR